MIRSRSKLFLHAKVARTGTDGETFDDAQAGHPIERRLNRIERVAAAYYGQVDLRFDDGMLVTFDSADGAVLGACEMQHRCAVLPQVSRQKLALRIGIHQGLVRQRSKDLADDAREIASRLARINDGILISREMGAGLGKELSRLARPLEEADADTPVFVIDWRREIPSGAYGGESFWPTSMHSLPASPYVYLHFGLKMLEVSENNPVATIGRDPASDLVLTDIHVSRNHCRIERTAKGVLLTDSSTNGTIVLGEGAQERLVKNSSVALEGRGMIFFGRPFKGERRGGIRYESF